jgi:uncharacterized tellurite resistance protein B-like protein
MHNLQPKLGSLGYARGMGIWELLGVRPTVTSTGGEKDREDVAEIVAALESLDQSRARYLAHFALLLGQVAHADLEISAEERRRIETILIDAGGLLFAEATLVTQIACSRTIQQAGTANHRIAQGFKTLSDREQRLALLHCLFAVSAADQYISVDEDNEIRRISMALDLAHEDFIKARSHFRQHLGVLKKD